MSRCAHAALVTLLLAAPCLAQGWAERREARRRDLYEGTETLRRILYDHDFQALHKADDLLVAPDRTLLVALGDLDVLATIKDIVPGGLLGFVHKGGAVLLASDRAAGGEARSELEAVAGVRITGETLNHAGDCYLGQPFCPRVIGGPSLFGGLDVFANIPSRLSRPRLPPEVRPLAYLPPGCYTDRPWATFLQQSLLAVGGDVGEGRVFVMADHSVFINQMMMQFDTNNVEFSYNLVRWLKGDHRNRVLFVEDGDVQTRLDIPLKSVAVPPEEALRLLFDRRNDILVEAEKTLTRMEDEDTFNRGLWEVLYRSGLWPERVARLGILLATVLVVLYLVYRLGVRARYRHDSSVPLLAPTLGKGLSAAPLVQQRQQGLLQSGNLREPASVLARRWFARLGVDVDARQTPTFEAAGNWWERWRLVRRLRWLWRLAAGRPAARVTPAELWRLQRELDALQAGWERGAWRVGNPVPLSSLG